MTGNRLAELFAKKNKNLLSVYFTAGFPRLEDTIPVLKALQEGGADFVEIGFPYSDPVADGPVIQHSSKTALDNGMSLKELFSRLKDIRKEISIPMVMMGYLNPVLQYGTEPFFETAASIGIDGLIIPDLPVHEYEKYRSLFEKNNIKPVFLITPQTSKERILEIDALSSEGFIYAVSSSSTTGGNISGNTRTTEYLERIAGLKLKNKVMLGFGVRDKIGFDYVCKYVSGAIVGTAFIELLKEFGADQKRIGKFLKGFLPMQSD